MKTIESFDLKGKTVLIRCDFNVPMENGKIVEDTRITASLKTIQYALSKDAKVVLLSHLGKVKEEKDKEGKSLAPVAKRLEELLKRPVQFLASTNHAIEKEKVDALKEGDILLLENTRFEDVDSKKESGNDKELAQFWASLADVFINDAFGTMHRSHASTVGVAECLKGNCGIGFLVQEELTKLSSLFHPEQPFVVILGGSKVQDKIGVIEKFAPSCSKILIGGGMAFPFLEAEGYEIGSSLKEEESREFCQKMLAKYPEKIVLPVDFNTAKEFKETKGICKDLTEFELDDMGLDIGPNTIKLFQNHLKDAKTVLWNGPMGVYEFPSFQEGTKELLKFLEEEKEKTKTVIGGGDTVACAKKNHYDTLYHLSTGGGATLSYLEQETLVGLEAMKEK